MGQTDGKLYTLSIIGPISHQCTWLPIGKDLSLMMWKRIVPPACLAVKDQSGKTWVWSLGKDLRLQCAWSSMTNQERPEFDDVEKICACKGHNGTFYSLTTDLHSHLQLLHQDGILLNSSTLLLLDVCTQQSSHHCEPLTKFNRQTWNFGKQSIFPGRSVNFHVFFQKKYGRAITAGMSLYHWIKSDHKTISSSEDINNT